MLIKVYNQEGKEVEEMELPDEVFGLKISSDLVHQAVVAQTANAREVLAHTKDRSEVSGGGKKPWRQKGTGRARHGSNRSPIWRGGGVTFGPTNERNFSLKINKKMRKRALLMVLSGKVKNDQLIVLDDLKINEAKAKEVAKIIKNLGGAKKDIKRGALVALAEKNENVIKAARNISKIETISIDSLNVVDVLKMKYLVMTKDGINKLKVKNEKEKTTAKK
jgi:large subunit ribosomal protein L4